MFRAGLSVFVVPFFAGHMPHQMPVRFHIFVVLLTSAMAFVAFTAESIPDDYLVDPIIFGLWGIVVFFAAPTRSCRQRLFRATSIVLIPLLAVVMLALVT